MSDSGSIGWLLPLRRKRGDEGMEEEGNEGMKERTKGKGKKKEEREEN